MYGVILKSDTGKYQHKENEDIAIWENVQWTECKNKFEIDITRMGCSFRGSQKNI